jgi:hypothetical protein
MRKLAILGAVAMLSHAPSIAAQSVVQRSSNSPNTASARVAVTVLLVDRLDDPFALATIIRRSDPVPQDLVFLRSDRASGDVLASAIFTLLVARSVGGDVPSAPMTTRVTRIITPSAWQHTELPRATRALDQLRTASERDISGFGRLRALDLYLPPNALKTAAGRR